MKQSASPGRTSTTWPEKIAYGIGKIEEAILSGSVMLIALLTITNVICRTLFQFSLAFAEEVTQFCVIVMCFVGLSYAAGRGRHIRMTAIYDQFSRPAKRRFLILSSGGTALLMFVLCYYSVRYVLAVQQLGGIYPALRVPFYLVYAIAPWGLFLAGIQYGLTTWRNLNSSEPYISPTLQEVPSPSPATASTPGKGDTP